MRFRRRPIQLSLDLPPRHGWGGARPGAGRPRGLRPRALHRERETFRGDLPSHVTLRVRRDVPNLRSQRFVRGFEESLRALRARSDFRILHYSIQGDHAHFVVEAKDRFALARGMKALGSRLARGVNRLFHRTGAVLDGRYHHRVLRTPREVRNALAYVLLNARKHAAERLRSASGKRTLSREALVARMPEPRIDPASSGRWFTGWAQGKPEATDPPPVAAGRSWLARVGWLRHRRIALDEIPGSRGAAAKGT